MKNFKIVWSSSTECGPSRDKNEDSIFPSLSGSDYPPFRAAVCDGLGGHTSGDIASKIAVDSLLKNFTDLNSLINSANDEIIEYQNQNPKTTGMGTTMTAINIDSDALMKIGHVGDSRCYVLSDRNLIKITEDDNVPGYQNVLKQALGSNEKLKILGSGEYKGKLKIKTDFISKSAKLKIEKAGGSVELLNKLKI